MSNRLKTVVLGSVCFILAAVKTFLQSGSFIYPFNNSVLCTYYARSNSGHGGYKG